ncbi:metallophosphoesterase family protein [Emticicia fluvialis]|uniref:metallophosphoesterase family protein n=1 Tax=Emticicia fluvialis TaxID=2974474 RepID=UPI002164FD23|nr:metallophosphoesterase family protein [Emticicia fluvialis]
MTTVGLISDTHGYLDKQVFEHFKNCDEIWHAGDVGSVTIIEQLHSFKPTRFVFGNIDSKEIQWQLPEHQFFELEGYRIWMTHIGGAPPNYNPAIKKKLKEQIPDIFVCGHSHILRVIRDEKKNNMLYMNPGAAGNEGFHKVKTLLKFSLDNRKMSNLEVVELGRRGLVIR